MRVRCVESNARSARSWARTDGIAHALQRAPGAQPQVHVTTMFDCASEGTDYLKFVAPVEDGMVSEVWVGRERDGTVGRR